MGAWGTGIYSNDTAEDVKCICQEIFPFVSVEEGNKIIFDEYEEIINSNIIDNDYASFWYALADWQWNHGILTEDIRSKAIALLEAHTGIDEWQASGSAKDVKKRIDVMDALKARLESEMPPRKIPAKRLIKPQHRVGDIIVFKTSGVEDDEYQNLWRVERMQLPYFYTDPTITQSSDVLESLFLAHSKYMAVLCVGTTKEPYSQYLPGLYNEHSAYAYYDYISSEPPTPEVLKKRGFLPQITTEWKKVEPGMSALEMNDLPIISLGWTYTSHFHTPIRVSKHSHLTDISKYNCLEESDRFHKLIGDKNYSDKSKWHFELKGAFTSSWEEKLRLERFGIQIDNLITPNVVNPELATPEMATMAMKKCSVKANK